MLRMVPLLVLLLAALPVRHAGYVLIPSDAPSKTPEQVQKAIDNWSTSISSEPAQTQVPPLYQAIFDSHNRDRAMHGAPALVWDVNLARSAMMVAQKCNFSHDLTLEQGENLAAVIATEVDPAEALQIAMDNWYDEVSLYDWKNPGFSFVAGHFTQVVWVATTNIGCATYFCNGNFWVDPKYVSGPAPKQAQFSVCHYMPPGNSWDFESNVLPKRALPPAPSPSPSPRPAAIPPPSPTPTPIASPTPSGPQLVGSMLDEGTGITSGTCMVANNAACRLCINNFGEISVLSGRTGTTVRWRNAMQLGQRGTNNKAPYTLSLNEDHTITVKNGVGKTMMMLAVPGDTTEKLSLWIRNDCKAVVIDQRGECRVAWGYGPRQPAGC